MGIVRLHNALENEHQLARVSWTVFCFKLVELVLTVLCDVRSLLKMYILSFNSKERDFCMLRKWTKKH